MDRLTGSFSIRIQSLDMEWKQYWSHLWIYKMGGMVAVWLPYFILLDQLSRLGVFGTMLLCCFTSFLQGSFQSVLFPLLFNIYMRLLGEFICHHRVRL